MTNFFHEHIDVLAGSAVGIGGGLAGLLGALPIQDAPVWTHLLVTLLGSLAPVGLKFLFGLRKGAGAGMRSKAAALDARADLLKLQRTSAKPDTPEAEKQCEALRVEEEDLRSKAEDLRAGADALDAIE